MGVVRLGTFTAQGLVFSARVNRCMRRTKDGGLETNVSKETNFVGDGDVGDG